MVAGIGGAHVEGHHDIRTQCMLDIHAYLGGDEAATAVQMALEGYALFFNLADAGKREYLKSAAVGKHGLGPCHELVQTAAFANQLLAGTQMQMIGVGKHDFCADFQHFTRSHGLNSGQRANRHVHRCMDIAMGRVQQAQTCSALLAGFQHFKRKFGGTHGWSPFPLKKRSMVSA